MASNSVCDGCGTVLGLPDAAGVVRCPSCGRVAWTEARNDPYGAEGPPPTPAPDPGPAPGMKAPPFATWNPGPTTQAWAPTALSGSPARSTSETKGARAGGCIVIVLATLGLLGGAIGVVVGLTSGNGPFGGLQTSQIYPNSGSTIVVPGEASTTDLVLLATDNGDGSQRKVIRMRMDADGGSETWKSAPLPKDLYRAELLIDGDDLWIGGGDHLILLSLRTGKQQWETTLTDNITTGCPSCFSVVGDSLVLRTDDAYVTGFSAASNESRWSRRLRSPSGNINVTGSALYVVDDPESADDLTQALQLDPATGQVLKTLTPSCPERSPVPYPIEMSGGDPIVAIPGSTDLVSWFGFGFGCVTRIDPTTGKAKWATALPNGNFEDLDELGALVDEGNLILQQSSGPPVRVDLATGKLTLLEEIPDAAARPRAIVGQVLLGETTSTRGSTKGGLAAWDLVTGKRLWDFRLPGDSEPVSADLYRSSDSLFEDDLRTLLVPGGSTTRLVTFAGDRSIKIQALDVATGELGTATTGTLRSRYESAGTPSLTVESVTPDRLVLGVDSIVQVLDLRTGDSASWPPKN